MTKNPKWKLSEFRTGFLLSGIGKKFNFFKKYSTHSLYWTKIIFFFAFVVALKKNALKEPKKTSPIYFYVKSIKIYCLFITLTDLTRFKKERIEVDALLSLQTLFAFQSLCIVDPTLRNSNRFSDIKLISLSRKAILDFMASNFLIIKPQEFKFHSFSSGFEWIKDCKTGSEGCVFIEK